MSYSFSHAIFYKAQHPRRRKREWRALHSHVCSRHRQTPVVKHDKKTRHVGLAHVTQPSYFALLLEIGDFTTSVIRCCVRCRDPFGIPRLLVAPPFSFSRTGKLPVLPVAVVIEVLASVPAARSVIAPYQNFGPVAGTWCRSSPRNRVTKSRTRRCQRSNLSSPSQFFSRECWKVYPILPPVSRGKCDFLKLCASAGVDTRRERAGVGRAVPASRKVGRPRRSAALPTSRKGNGALATANGACASPSAPRRPLVNGSEMICLWCVRPQFSRVRPVAHQR